jgi:AmmeMemoRadiSam system protein A
MEATPSTRLEPGSRDLLLRTAASAIEAGLALAATSWPDPRDLPPDLRQHRASFVTLTIEDRLRGCCGSLEPRRPLAVDVWLNAQASAFHDSRFAPLASWEWSEVDVEVSVLSPLEAVPAGSEAELLRAIRPGADGLVIAWRGRRATFLPKVWEQFASPPEFLRHLKQKAGWAGDFWSPDVEAWRYHTETFGVARPANGPASRPA